jgi:cyclopropane fatty-acyl-phospholipid synthase-like methyltransferase
MLQRLAALNPQRLAGFNPELLAALKPQRLAAFAQQRLLSTTAVGGLLARLRPGNATGEPGDLPPPLKARARAWWDGVAVSELPPEMLERKVKGKADKGEGDSKAAGLFARLRGREGDAWADPRLTVYERLWGEAMTGPGGRDFVLAMIASLGIDKKMSLLEIGAGLGGSTRIIAKETGAWVTGLEPDAALAKAGMELSSRSKLKKRAPIEPCDLAEIELEAVTYPVIFSLETFFKVANKAEFYAKIYRSLKPEGQLLFTDIMVPEPNPQGEAYEKWATKERVAPHPWTVEETRSSLEYHGFEVRITEDITAEYSRMALQALGGFAGELKPGRIDKSMAAAVLDEVERWSYRLALFESGGLAVYRVYARKKPDAHH